MTKAEAWDIISSVIERYYAEDDVNKINIKVLGTYWGLKAKGIEDDGDDRK